LVTKLSESTSFQNLTQPRKRPAANAASTAKKSRSSSKNGGDADKAAAALVGLSSLLERREAQPWRDRADIEFVGGTADLRGRLVPCTFFWPISSSMKRQGWSGENTPRFAVVAKRRALNLSLFQL
jgi:hypothetical protein